MMSKTEEQLSLLATTDLGNFGHGGKRAGSGRKQGEPTTVVRVPNGVLDEVKEVIARYKAKQ